MRCRTRLSVEALEDRLTPSLTYYASYTPDQFLEITQGPWGSSDSTDFNSDGWLDRFEIPFISDLGATGVVYLNRGDGTFYYWQSFSVGLNPQGDWTGDFNGDGGPDLFVGEDPEFGGLIEVFLNDGIWPNSPQLSIDGATVNEGNQGLVEAVFAVTLENGPDEPVTVQYATIDGNASADSDYQATSGTLRFEPGETTKTITVLVNGDRMAEGNENFFVLLSNATGAVIVDDYGSGDILDDEPTVSIGDVTVTECNIGTVNTTFTLTLSSAAEFDVTVHYDTANKTALSGSDYVGTSGDVVIPPGQTSATFTVAVMGDRLPESTETFFVNLSGASNASIMDCQGSGTILDDEPCISISDVAKREGRKNTTSFVFTVTLSAAYDEPVTVSFRSVDGTATTSDGDYIAKTGILTFAPGETTKTITIEVKGDSKRESDETFYLDLFGNSSNSLLVDSRGIGSILNDD